jgi:uncharacterized protein (DUF488 family)
VQRLLDVRLKNTSQLAGFAKASDIEFFLERVAGISYQHEELLAPTEDLLGAYRKRELDWPAYEDGFVELLAEREIQNTLTVADFQATTALLCSEATAECCHRRLVCEYLAEYWSELKAEHL